MSQNSDDINPFMMTAKSDPNLIFVDSVILPFDGEVLYKVFDSPLLENFVEETRESYEVLVKRVVDNCCSGLKNTRELLKEHRDELDLKLSKNAISNGNRLFEGEKKTHLKKLEVNSPSCTKKRRRTSVVRREIANGNKAKALKAKEDRERRQFAALNRRQDMDDQGTKCSGRPVVPLTSQNVVKVGPRPVPKQESSKEFHKEERMRHFSGNNPPEQIEHRKVIKKQASKEKNYPVKCVQPVSSVVANSEHKEKKICGNGKPIKGVLKKKTIEDKTENNKSVRFDETVATPIDVEAVSIYDATIVAESFDENKAPSWAKKKNIELTVLKTINTEDEFVFPFLPTELIEYYYY